MDPGLAQTPKNAKARPGERLVLAHNAHRHRPSPIAHCPPTCSRLSCVAHRCWIRTRVRVRHAPRSEETAATLHRSVGYQSTTRPVSPERLKCLLGPRPRCRIAQKLAICLVFACFLHRPVAATGKTPVGQSVSGARENPTRQANGSLTHGPPATTDDGCSFKRLMATDLHQRAVAAGRELAVLSAVLPSTLQPTI